MSYSFAHQVRCRSLDLHTSQQVQQVSTRMEELNQYFDNRFGIQEMVLGRIEDFTRSSRASSASSIRTLDSISSSLSRLKSRLASLRSTRDESPVANKDCEADKSYSLDNNRQHPLYRMERKADGLFHCPFADEEGCPHEPDKLKCNYE